MSWNGKYREMDFIMDKLFRNAEYRDEFTIEEAAEWAGDVLGLIGSPLDKVEKVTDGNNSLNHPDPIQIVDYRGVLPADMYGIKGVRDSNTKQRYRKSSDSFHLAFDQEDIATPDNAPSYKLQGNFIFTSTKEAELEIAYVSLAVSATGLPLIADEPSVALAVEWHIREQIDYRLMRRGTLQQSTFQYTSQQRDWCVGKAQTALLIPDEDEMEAIQNLRLRLRPQINDWENYFKNTGKVEQRRISQRPRYGSTGTIVTLAGPGDNL